MPSVGRRPALGLLELARLKGDRDALRTRCLSYLEEWAESPSCFDDLEHALTALHGDEHLLAALTAFAATCRASPSSRQHSPDDVDAVHGGTIELDLTDFDDDAATTTCATHDQTVVVAEQAAEASPASSQGGDVRDARRCATLAACARFLVRADAVPTEQLRCEVRAVARQAERGSCDGAADDAALLAVFFFLSAASPSQRWRKRERLALDHHHHHHHLLLPQRKGFGVYL